jgi:diaminobutyrate-2-oxoglutarate transaminase
MAPDYSSLWSAAAVTARAYQNGLIIERAGPEDEVIKCMMPLTTTYAELDEGMDILEQAMADEYGAVDPIAAITNARSRCMVLDMA